jgi:uncharacterized membrane protein HdeD (DUF308 family)
MKEDIMNEFAAAVKAGGKKMTVFGVLAIILGFLTIAMPALVGTSVLIILGVLVLAAGIVRIVWAFNSGTVGKGILTFAIGLLTVLCGVSLIANPLFASGLLSILLPVYLIVDGLVEIVAGLKRKPGAGWGWFLAGGIVSILLGVMLWKQFPLSGIWAIGVLLGIKLCFIGLIMITAGTTVRQAIKA